MTPPVIEKPLMRIGSAKKDLVAMPKAVRKVFGHALHLAQLGARGESTKILSGFGSAGVVEVIEDDATDTYRAV